MNTVILYYPIRNLYINSVGSVDLLQNTTKIVIYIFLPTGVIMKKLQIFAFAILLLGVANCQSWKILTTDGNKFKFDNLSIVQNDTLVGIESGDVIGVPIQNILIIRRYRNINVGNGIMGGCIGWPIGGLMGASAAANYETGAAVGVVIGVITGYLIFSKSLGIEYKLNNMNLEQKIVKINKLIEKYEK